jgi:ClpP class serine protease
MNNGLMEIPEELRQMIDVEQEKDKKVTDFAKKRNCIMLAVIASYVPRKISPSESEYASLGISEEFGIETVLSQISESAKESERSVFLLLNSMGGSLQSSYKTAKAIRDSFKKITVFVPHMALSGGTVVALAGDNIVMGRMSQLSPLDVQLSLPAGFPVSANDFLRCKARLDEFFKDRKVESVPYSWKVLADNLDGTIIENVTSAQETACQYVTEILKKSKYPHPNDLARALVYNLPSHGFVIDYERAKKLDLKVKQYAEDLEAWEIMRYWLAKYIVKATDRHFIRFAIPKKESSETKPKKS